MSTAPAEAIPDPGTAPSMRPVAFDGCFGWLHAPPGDAASGLAVLLCPGLTTDGLTGHRALRHLADALAAAGYPTLRFDYPGTGDSEDLGTAEPWSAWQRSLHAAADRLRGWTGARRLVLAGLRLGATLAAVAAEARDDVAGLVLLAPILRGRSYIRQITIEASLHRAATGPAADGPTADGTAAEPELPAATTALIARVELAKLRPKPGCRIAVHAAPSPLLADCAAAWGAAGATVTCAPFAGLDPMLRPSFMSHEPDAGFAPVTAWLRTVLPPEPLPTAATPPPPHPLLRPAGCTEAPLRFGPGGALFGLLCRPDGPAETGLAVVIGNSSGNPHYGFGRVAVDLARRLAAEGIASLRMDFAGLGDSLAPDDAETHIMETDRTPDLTAAVDALAALGYRRFAVHGLCSGAYHALRAALADPRLGTVLLVNLPVFQWRAGDPVEFLNHPTLAPPPLPDADAAIRRDVQHLSRTARTLFLFSPEEMGLAALRQAFGAVALPTGVTVRVVAGLDHSLTGAAMRRVAAEEVIEFLMKSEMDL